MKKIALLFVLIAFSGCWKEVVETPVQNRKSTEVEFINDEIHFKRYKCSKTTSGCTGDEITYCDEQTEYPMRDINRLEEKVAAMEEYLELDFESSGYYTTNVPAKYIKREKEKK